MKELQNQDDYKLFNFGYRWGETTLSDVVLFIFNVFGKVCKLILTSAILHFSLKFTVISRSWLLYKFFLHLCFLAKKNSQNFILHSNDWFFVFSQALKHGSEDGWCIFLIWPLFPTMMNSNFHLHQSLSSWYLCIF